MTTKDINILIDRYLAGETTPEEERQLALEMSREDAPAEWRAIAGMLGDLTLGEAMYDDIMQRRKDARARRRRMWMGWSAAASIAVVLLTGTLLFGGHYDGDDIQLAVHVDSVRVDTVVEKGSVDKKQMDDKAAEKMIRDIHRIANPQRIYIAQSEEVDDSLRNTSSVDYDYDYAEVEEPIMILDMDLDEFRSRIESLSEAVAMVRDDFDDE